MLESQVPDKQKEMVMAACFECNSAEEVRERLKNEKFTLSGALEVELILTIAFDLLSKPKV